MTETTTTPEAPERITAEWTYAGLTTIGKEAKHRWLDEDGAETFFSKELVAGAVIGQRYAIEYLPKEGGGMSAYVKQAPRYRGQSDDPRLVAWTAETKAIKTAQDERRRHERAKKEGDPLDPHLDALHQAYVGLRTMDQRAAFLAYITAKITTPRWNAGKES